MRRALLSLAFLGLLGCEPSPERFSLATRSPQAISLGSPQTTSLVEGDLLVLDANPLDDDGSLMELCVTGTTTNASSVEVRRVQGNCRLFILSAKAPGSATIRFSARNGSEALDVTVTPVPLEK